MIGLRPWLSWFAAVAAVVLVPAGFLGYAAWQEEHGSPMPLSDGTYGVAFSPDGRLLATAGGGSGVLWNVADPARDRPSAVSRITTITGNRIGAGEVAFCPGGSTVAGAPTTGDTLALWTLP